VTKRTRWLAKAEAGVTLVELMVVLVVIAVGLLALSAVQTHSSSDVYATGRRTRAMAVAENQMEQARALGYAGAVADSGTTDNCTWNTRVDSVGTGLNRITVTVNWTESGAPRTIHLLDLVSTR